MDGLLGIFQNISNAGQGNLPIFLKALNEHQCFRQASAGTSEFVSHLTALLSKPATKHEGLVVLEVILKQCSLDILEQKGSLWATSCIKTCSQKGMSACVPLACRCLSVLIEKSTDIPELSKAFSGHLLSKFFESINNSATSNQLEVLKCIETALRVYPGSCGASRSVIEKFVLLPVDSSDNELVRWSGKCLHLLQQVRGGGTAGISYKDAWQKFQCNLLGSLHETLDQTYANCPEVYDFSSESDKLNIVALELSDEPIKRASQLFTRFKNLTTFLIVALTEPFPVPKPIMPKKILYLIQRGLAVNCTILGKNAISDNLAVGTVLPELHIELYNLVDALILTLKSHMALYVSILLNLILETLKWTDSGKSMGFTKPFSSLRIAAYKTLSLWNKTMKYGSCCELIAEHVIVQIKRDIMPFQNEVTLKVLSGGKKHISKKARRLLHKAQNERSNISQTHSKVFNPQNTKIIFSDEENQSLCAAALNCLEYLIMSSSCFLKPVVIKDVLDTIFSIAIDVLNNDDLPRTKLYSQHLCRRNLYSVVYAIMSEPHHLCPPPIQLAIDIFSAAQIRDKHILVRSKCREHFKAIVQILHPHKESLCFSVDRNDVRNALRNYKTDDEKIGSSLHEDEHVDKEDEPVEIDKADKIFEVIDAMEIDDYPKIMDIDSKQTDNETIQNISDDEINISSRSTSPEVIGEFVELSNESFTIRDTIELTEDGIKSKSSRCDINEPKKKKQRISLEHDVELIDMTKKSNDVNLPRINVEPDVQVIDVTEKATDIEVPKTDDVILEELASAFVDELN